MTAVGTDTAEALATEITRLNAALATAHAALDMAESRERSRIADDLHDILGHALEVVALKAELADRLLYADAARSHAEMIEIQRVARSAMNDVRSLVRCRRPTDLQTELIGAVSLFESAGVEVIVTGDAQLVAGCARDLLARVLREAVTNVLRHAKPTRCLITVEQNSLDAAIAVVNDGVEAKTTMPSAGGTGLAGLSRLLGDHGGRLHAGYNGSGHFTLRATVSTPTTTLSGPGPAYVRHAGRAGARRFAAQR